MQSYDHIDLNVCAIMIHCGSLSVPRGTPEIRFDEVLNEISLLSNLNAVK